MKKKSKQPYRLWFQYLQTCLNYEQFRKKINTKFYKSWNLNNVKKQRFDEWFKSHSHLFEEYESHIKLYSGKKTPNTILVEIPTNYNVHKIQTEIGSIVSEKINQSNANFSITSNRSLQIAPLDYFLWCWKWRQQKKYQVRGGLEMIWEELQKRVLERQKKYEKGIKKGTIKRRAVAGLATYMDAYKVTKTMTSGKTIMVSRNIKKAENILFNVCKGKFPGLSY
jgi:predicted DNA-binding protein YlxM (UPF0122 family)